MNKYKEEEEYRPYASGRIYDFDSDESLNRYDHENFCVPPFQPTPTFCKYGSSDRLYQANQLQQRRHSSYSHEDILNMKYQNPPVDPRYRDNRPFASSNSSLYDHGRRDFMSRRRSSSSLQDDMLRPFQHIQLDNYLRKNNPVIHNNSSPNLTKCNSNWNLNPSIYIEEYNDNAAEVKSNNSSTNLSFTEAHQPLNEETVAPFAGCDEIPFIDDEHDKPVHYCDIFMPILNCVEQQRHQSSETKPMPSYIKNRKTVSFDLVDSNEELNKIRQSHLLNKSNTCDHITTIRLSDHIRPGTKPPPPPPLHPFKRQTSAPTEPLFKFCTLKNSNIPINEPTQSFKDQTNLDNDSLSAYFYDDNNHIDDYHTDQLLLLANKESKMNEPQSIIDTKSILLDLSELNSDSTSSSTSTEPIEIKSTTINPSFVNQPSPRAATTTTKSIHGIEKFAYIPLWNPPQFYDHIAYGNGKVRALKNYFEGLKMPMKQFSESTPDLCKKPDKLTDVERDNVLEQLKEWSEFGTMSKSTDVNQVQTNKSIQTNPVTRSVLNLTVTTSYNDQYKDHLTVAARSSSEPDVNDYILTENMLLPTPKKRKKLPIDCSTRNSKICTNIKTTHKITKSCPNLCHSNQLYDKPYYVSSRLHTSIHNSPSHRSTNLTVRKVKHNQKSKNSRARGDGIFADSDAAEEAR